MENNIKVSIICNTYNHEKYVAKCLDGFLMQKTNFNFEILIHDDASTDKTKEIIKSYQERFPNVIKPIYQTENQFSKGIKISQTFQHPRVRGCYVAFCEGDDCWLDENKLQTQVDFLDSNKEYSACVHNSENFNALRGKKEGNVSQRENDCDLIFRDVCKKGSAEYQSSSLVYRAEFLHNKPKYFDKAKTYGDYPLAIYLTTNHKIRYFAGVWSRYNFLSSGNAWTLSAKNQGREAEIFESVIEMLEATKEYLNNNQILEIDKAILEHKFKILELREEYKQIKKGSYRALYNSKGIKYRFKIFLLQYFPFIMKLKRKLKKQV